VGKNKLKKFAENETFDIFVQAPRPDLLDNGLALKGKWHSDFFNNDRPIVVELGCGKGEYTVGLAEKFPEKNFIGVDIKGARMWRGARTATDDKMNNVGFLRTKIELINYCFSKGEVSEIWITFPDPHIKYRRRKKRLTAPDMLEVYRDILSDKGVIFLKTDSQFLHGYTLGIIEGFGHELLDSSYDIDAQKPNDTLLQIRTNYEEIFRDKGMTITYLKFKLSKRD
jgi:tRNA (guanine-N7-)-methyltransferase